LKENGKGYERKEGDRGSKERRIVTYEDRKDTFHH
jgi:hypothetical protein